MHKIKKHRDELETPDDAALYFMRKGWLNYCGWLRANGFDPVDEAEIWYDTDFAYYASDDD